MRPEGVKGFSSESTGESSFIPVGEEREFARKLAARDERAWRDFFEIYGDSLYSNLYYTLKRHNFSIPREDINDALQDLLTRLLEDGGRRLLSFQAKNGCRFGSWLRVVCANHALALIRQWKKTSSVEALGPEKTHQILEKQGLEVQVSPGESVDRETSLRAVEEAVKSLPRRERLVFNLYYRDENSRREIAALLHIRPNHVDQILYRIRETIRKFASGVKFQ